MMCCRANDHDDNNGILCDAMPLILVAVEIYDAIPVQTKCRLEVTSNKTAYQSGHY